MVYGSSFGASHQECSEAFGLVNELLLRFYYLYEKSPRRCRELEDIITDLKVCFSFDDAGAKPVCASGSRWVVHKQNAMKRVLSKFGIYTAHLVALAKDRSLKPADHVKLKGYYNKWTDTKYLFGCALFVDLLTPCMIFFKLPAQQQSGHLGSTQCPSKNAKGD